MVWYGIPGFNVPLDTVQVISETWRRYLTSCANSFIGLVTLHAALSEAQQHDLAG